MINKFVKEVMNQLQCLVMALTFLLNGGWLCLVHFVNTAFWENICNRTTLWLHWLTAVMNGWTEHNNCLRKSISHWWFQVLLFASLLNYNSLFNYNSLLNRHIDLLILILVATEPLLLEAGLDGKPRAISSQPTTRSKTSDGLLGGLVI